MNKCFLIIPHHEKDSEHYYRVLLEILIYLNDNIKRIEDILEINNNEKPEKNKIKNSFELFNFYINSIIQFHKRYTEISIILQILSLIALQNLKDKIIYFLKI